MDVFITYKDKSGMLPDSWIRDVNEFAHNSQMRLLILRTEKRAYFINVDTIRLVEIAEGEERPKPTL